MRSEHDEAQEVLAPYALHALDPPDLERAEVLLAGHVPGCVACREELEAFREVAADLALAAGSRQPPRTLAARIRRELGPQRRLARLPYATAAAAVATVAALGLWNAHLTTRVSDAEQRQARTTEVLATVSHPESQVVPLPVEGLSPGRAHMTATFVPGRSNLYLFGSMPSPRGDRVYQVWLSRDGGFASAGTFVPESGLVLIQIRVDPRGYEGILVTEEPGKGSSQPSGRRVATGLF